MSVFVYRYEQTAAQVKGLENRAELLSREARDEDTLANSMLKDITHLEQELPSALKVRVQEFSLRNPGGLTCVLLIRMGRTAWPLC